MAGVVATPAAPLAAPLAGYLTPSGPLAQCHAPEREVSGPPQGQVVIWATEMQDIQDVFKMLEENMM